MIKNDISTTNNLNFTETFSKMTKNDISTANNLNFTGTFSPMVYTQEGSLSCPGSSLIAKAAPSLEINEEYFHPQETTDKIFDNVLFKHIYSITKVEVLKENMVMRFTFSNDKIIKTICQEDDQFDFEYAFYLAYAKLLYKNTLTGPGIEEMAKHLKYIASVNKYVNKGMKLYYKQKKQNEDTENKEKRIEKITKGRRSKKKITVYF